MFILVYLALHIKWASNLKKKISMMLDNSFPDEQIYEEETCYERLFFENIFKT